MQKRYVRFLPTVSVLIPLTCVLLSTFILLMICFDLSRISSEFEEEMKSINEVYKVSDQLLSINEDRTRRSLDPEEVAFFAANISRSANLLNSVRHLESFLSSLEERIAIPKVKKKKRICICYSSEYRKCPQGSQGPPGAVGKPGLDGVVGVNGMPGQPGKDAPAYVLPEECYQCLSPGGLPGPPGAHGILLYSIDPSESSHFAGVAGLRGKPGKPGCGGSHGENGLPGPPGPMGVPGQRGKRGPIGHAGQNGTVVMGIRGIKGPTGEMGNQGLKGAPGRLGSLGLSGDRGDVGEPGDVGELGPTGPVGEPGLPGNNGLDGYVCPCPSRTLPTTDSRWNRLKSVFQRGKP
ncbi:hypothetical protein M514_10950 [Trichuris suis]|uniref:Collagen triple helix repeat protein n=1 Tax=Trichuris suis TaxID=68888 RepID=A0A085LT68_9BILA|nr:hypothetical protein M513_10950 [Trichuris suis]KFD61901.1 hypothetical protein M514_10950 [Trichuris suis]